MSYSVIVKGWQVITFISMSFISEESTFQYPCLAISWFMAYVHSLSTVTIESFYSTEQNCTLTLWKASYCFSHWKEGKVDSVILCFALLFVFLCLFSLLLPLPLPSYGEWMWSSLQIFSSFDFIVVSFSLWK